MAKYKQLSVLAVSTPYSLLRILPNVGNGSGPYAFLDNTSQLWTWNANGNIFTLGTLGNNTTSPASSPISISNPPGRPWSKVVSNGITFVGLDNLSYAWAWGFGGNGETGTSTTTNQSTPTSVFGARQWRDIAIGSNNIVGLDSNSYAWQWGQTYTTSTSVNLSSPASVVGGLQFSRLIARHSVTPVALNSNSYAWSWGYNSEGETGSNTTLNASSPLSIVGGIQWRDIAFGNGIAIGVSTLGYAWGWGGQFVPGSLGDGTTNYRSSPSSVLGGNTWTKLVCGSSSGSATLATGLSTLGYAWSWGYGSGGGLGNNGITNQSSPVSVVGGRLFSDVVMGYTSTGIPNTCALEQLTGNVWCWGSNQGNTSVGIGDGANVNRSSPVAVLGLPSSGPALLGVGDSFLFTDYKNVWSWHISPAVMQWNPAIPKNILGIYGS